MTDPKPGFLVRFLPSLTDVVFLLPIVFLFWQLGGPSNIIEGDTGWHIRTGEWIMKNGRVPTTDLFSFSKPGAPWFAWEWLWDVIFAWIHGHGGLPAVVFTSLLIICLTFALLFRLVRSKCENVLVAFAVVWVAIAGSSMHWWARPHLFTLLFTVLFCSAIERHRRGSTRALWLLPPVMVLWVNLHGGFVVGIVLLAAWCAGELISAAVEFEKATRLRALRAARPYALTLLGCLLATFVNPYFYRLHGHIYRTLTDPDSPLFRFVSEWQPLSLRGVLALYAEPFIVLAVAAALWHLLNRRFAWPILIFGWLHLAFGAGRNFPIFLLIAAPVAAETLEEGLRRLGRAGLASWIHRLLNNFNGVASEFGAIDRLPRVHVASLAGAALVGALLLAPHPQGKLQAKYDPKRYPVSTCDKFVSGFTGNVLTNDEWGDYLIYRFPEKRVFIDGRFDFYGGKFTEKYMDLMNVKYGWEKNLRAFDIQTVLLSVDAPLSATFKESRRWRPVYDDGVAIVFRPADTLAAGVPNSSIARPECGNNHRDREVARLDRDLVVTRLETQRR